MTTYADEDQAMDGMDLEEVENTPAPEPVAQPTLPVTIQVPPAQRPSVFRSVAANLGQIGRSVAAQSKDAARVAAQVAAQNAGHVITTILDEEGNPVEVELEPAAPKVMMGGEDLSDLFEGPQENDSDIYSDDLVAPPGDDEVGVDPEDDDFSDVLGLEPLITPPPGTKIVRKLGRPRTSRPLPSSLGGMR